MTQIPTLPSLSVLVKILPALGLLLTGAHATDYTWISTENSAWQNAANWSPAGIPGASDNIIGSNNISQARLVDSGAEVNNITYNGNAGNWQITGVSPEAFLNIGGTLTLTGESTFTLRRSTGASLDVTVANIQVSANGGRLFLGSNNNENSLASLEVTGTTSISSGELRVNSASDYSIGRLAISGGDVYLNTALSSIGSQQATTTGLTGAGGTLTGSFNTGNAVTLRIEASEAASSATTIGDGNSALSLVIAGSATQTLSGNNTFTGGTLVESGTLVAASANALGQGNVTVNGGTLDSSVDTASLGGNFEMSAGQLSINGSDIGSYQVASGENFTLTGGTLSFNYNDALETADSIDSLGGASAFDLSAGFIDLNDDSWNYSISYQLFSGFDSGTVGDIEFINYDSNNWQAMLNDSGELSFSAIPESNASLLLAPLSALLVVMVTRKWRHAAK